LEISGVTGKPPLVQGQSTSIAAPCGALVPLVSVAAELPLASDVSLMAKFDGDFGSGSQTYAGTGTLRYIW